MDFNDPSFRELLDALHDGVYITAAVSYTHLTLPTKA